MSTRLPEPSPPDFCGGCGRDMPLWTLSGTSGLGGEHVHRCVDCLRAAVVAAGGIHAGGGHDPREEPTDCLLAVLHELAGSAENRGALLNHGLRALRELEHRWLNAEAQELEARDRIRDLEAECDERAGCRATGPHQR